MHNRVSEVAAAMAAKRAELINQPLARIWEDLAQAALDALQWQPSEAAQTCNSYLARALAAEANLQWQPIATAPRDGTKVDLLYPYPRGRTINCEFRTGGIYEPDGGWFWKRPTWKDGELLPESEWNSGCYPNMQPTHWMPIPPEVMP